MKRFFSLLYDKFSAPLLFAVIAATFVVLVVPSAGFASEAAISKYFRNRSNPSNFTGNLNCPSGWTQVDSWLVNEGDSADGGGGQHRGLACTSSAYTAAFSKYYRTNNRSVVPPCPAGWTQVDSWSIDEGDNSDGYGNWHGGVACASNNFQSAISKYYRDRSNPAKFKGNLGCPSGWTGVDSWLIDEGDSADGGGGNHKGLACVYSGAEHTKTYTKYYRSKTPVSCPAGWKMIDSWAVHEGDKNDGYGGWHAGGVCSQTPVVSQPPVDFPAGDIIVNTTKNGSPWDAPILTANYTTSDGTFTSDFDFPQTFTGVQTGTYTVNWVTAPANENVTLTSVTPSLSQNLPDGGTITFTLNFETTVPANGTIIVNATQDGVAWDSPPFAVAVNTPSGPFTGTVDPVDTISAGPGLYTVTSVTRPAVSPPVTVSGISPSASQTLISGGTITFTVNFTTTVVPPSGGLIIVRTVKDGIVWDSPPFTANYTGPGGIGNAALDTDASGQQTFPSSLAGMYTVNGIDRIVGVTFQNINGSSLPYSQTLSDGGTITFTLNFVSPVAPAPDIISFINSFSAPVDGTSAVFSGSVRNAGNAPSGATSAHWVIDGVPFGDRSVSGLSAGGAQAVTSDSWTATKGMHTIQLCADAVSGETNSSNNCDQFSFGVLPDLVARFDAIAGVGVGVPFVFSGAVENSTLTAKASADPSNARFRVGKCTVVRGRVRCSVRALTTVIGIRSVGSLAIGASESMQSDSWTPSSAGEYVAQLCADYDFQIDEMSDGNNCTPINSGLFTVGVPPPPPPPAPACSDGIDNDGDGLIDFPADPGCANANDTDEGNLPPAPATPALNIDANSLLTCGSIGLWWGAVANATYYEINRIPGGAGGVGFPQNVGNALVWDDISIDQGRTYRYELRACNSFGCSAYSASVSDSNDSPEARFSSAPLQPKKNQITTFTDSSRFFGASRQSRLWQFSGGTPATATSSPAQTSFNSAGVKTVRLSVTDTASRSCALEKDVMVASGDAPPGWEEIPPE